ncbi:MAG: 3-dehydroquinate synthase [Candidatus Latescibacterota bacterium]|nr:3-dehydroquinate synthase [Candidatus Latescibacterota bacterium]
MKSVTVRTEGAEYDIKVGHGVLASVGSACQSLDLGARVALVTDERVATHYLQPVTESLSKAGFDVLEVVYPGGEGHKNLSGAEGIFAQLIEAGLDRSAWVLALGGGIVGDMAGFVAASYLRGVPYVQVPTTIVAQVDSSIGGKTGVNHALGKNLIGAFHQPKLVFVDTDTLRSLPRGELVAGMAEVVKHGIIRDAELFSFLEDHIEEITDMSVGADALDWLIAQNAGIKAAVVSADEKEGGVRAILNYGHTIGHAIEAATNYTRYRHGEAVILGALAVSEIAAQHGVLPADVRTRHDALWKRLGVPQGLASVEAEAILQRTRADKKRVGNTVRYILAEEIGCVDIYSDVSDEMALSAIHHVQQNY